MPGRQPFSDSPIFDSPAISTLAVRSPVFGSMANVAYAVTNGAPLEEIRAWCQDTLAPVFGGRNREVLFRGYIAYLFAKRVRSEP
jgi:hypothetical protein